MNTGENNKIPYQLIVPIALLFLFLIIPLFVGDYLKQVILFALISAYLCGAWNISAGYGGLTSFGHAAFIGIGAYSTAILLLYHGLPGWVGMIVGGLLSAFLGYLLSWAICRFHVRGFYFAVSTILLSEILMSIVVRTRYFGRGMGITFPAVDNPFNFQFSGVSPYYYMAVCLVCLMVLITHLLERSRLGWYLRATRQSEIASSALGINVTMVKVASMTLSAFLTGIGGGVYVLALRFCSPYDVFGIMFSTTLMLGTLLGGRATVYGPIIGIFMLTVVKEGLTFTAEALGGVSSFALVLVAWGIILCFVAKYLSNGIGPWVRSKLLKGHQFVEGTVLKSI
jgi:branched-chain amino acid transport system permease protein